MASITELDTFVQKFKQLWKSGLQAHLDLDSNAGQAWVGLRLHLGDDPGGPLHRVSHPNRNSPSRDRRRERRAAEREEKVKANDEVDGDINEEKNMCRQCKGK